MVIRYIELNKIKNLLKKDKNFNFFLSNTLISNYIDYSIHKVNKTSNLYFFRYFFWLYNNNCKYNNFIYFYKYYLYVVNYINLLKYFKTNSIKYYLVSNITSLKINKVIFKKFISYLIDIKKIEIIFTFGKNSINLPTVKNLKLLDKNLIIFLVYLNFL